MRRVGAERFENGVLEAGFEATLGNDVCGAGISVGVFCGLAMNGGRSRPC